MSIEPATGPEFDSFCLVFSDYFELPRSIVTSSARLDHDLGLDSLAILECIVMLEEAAGHDLELDAITTVRTVGELFNYYWQFVASTIDPGTP